MLSTMFYGYFCNLEMGERQLCGKVSLHCSFCFIDRLAKNVIFCKVVLLELLVIIPNSTKLSLILTCEILPCIGLWIANCELSRFLYTYFPFTKVKILSTHNLRRLLLRWQMVKTLGVVLSNVKCNFMQGSNIHCEHARPCQCVPGDFSRDSTFSPEKNILMNV